METSYFIEKSRAVLLLDALKNINAQSVLSPELQTRELQLRQRIFALEQKHNTAPNDNKIANELITAKEQYQTFVKGLETQNPNYYALKYKSEVVSLPKFKKYLLDNNQSFISYFVGDSCVYGLAIVGNKTIFKKINYKNYIADIQQYTTKLQAQKLRFDASATSLSYRLFQTLFQPFALPKGRLVLSLDGALFPVEALLTNANDNRSFLLKDYAISYAYSANTLLEKPQKSSWFSRSMLGFAPVNFSQNLSLMPLAGADVALGKIQKNYFLGSGYTGKEATKQRFLDKADNYKILQLLTHGKAEHNAKGAAVFFADSALYLSELYNQPPLSAKLAVLSACETGVGELHTGEGAMSMARGFAFVGVPSIVTTLWTVSSNETYDLTELFYDFLNDQPKDVALQQAKIKLLETNPLPYYWSGMVLIGDSKQIQDNSRWLYACLGILVVWIFFFLRRKK